MKLDYPKLGLWSLGLLVTSVFASPAVNVSTTAFKPAVKLYQQNETTIISVSKINPTTAEILYSNGNRLTIDFYGNNIFRLFQDNNGGIIRAPKATPPAQILVDNPRKAVSKFSITKQGDNFVLSTEALKLIFAKNAQDIKVYNLKNNQLVADFNKAFKLEKDQVSLSLAASADEYFYGGGVQNGRFSHKGKVIAIENQNSWTDGGVASPNPFYWSTKGYGILWHTFKKGKYDFGSKSSNLVELSHETDYLDLFVMVNDGAVALLNDFYQLTGFPVLIPKFGFYEGHLNAYNRDYWKEDEKGILFEDGKRYKESQKDNGGIKESLNGEKNNYQFSARAVIDRYKAHDMPLGWILPNDGYGAGYGQTSTLDSNVANLKLFGDYAHKHGVEIGLWTQSDLHPKAGVSALLQRDIVKEMRDAGVRVLKTDVAWVGAGYSFGLNGVADVGTLMPYYGNDARPFIISLDGWAGTQRYAGIWSGDQVGGQWEYIRFHIPTYIGSGLSGNPSISSDMDGIFGGKNVPVNVRDFQWKTFTPMQLNMDGWGSNEKYPHALGEPASSINRTYLKLKSELMPYIYSVAHQAVAGKPMIRAMFLDDPNSYTLGTSTQYQYMFGDNFLVAPIYQNTKADEQGNDIRNGIYLPAGDWFDYFSGEKYSGNRILNNFDSPLWKLPLFVKAGAIIPMANANNNPAEINAKYRAFEVYPAGNSSFNLYDDDGKTEAYKYNQATNTLVGSVVDEAKKTAVISIEKTTGTFDGFEKNKASELRINVSVQPKSVVARIDGKKVTLQAASSLNEWKNLANAYYYDAQPNLNKYATKGSDFEQVKIQKNPQVLVKLAETDITAHEISVEVKGFELNPKNTLLTKSGQLSAIANAQVSAANAGPYTLTPTWIKQDNADYYEIKFNDLVYSTIKDTSLLFEGLRPETDYNFQVRAVNKDGNSAWTSFSARTKNDPLEFAIKGIRGEANVESQGGSVKALFDFDEANLWHSKWGQKAVPFDLVIDLKSINQLDKFSYLVRDDAGNGTILEGKVFYSFDKQNWIAAGDFNWAKNSETKTFNFVNKPTARFIKLAVSKAVGDFGSGRELYVFKVPGTESYLPGDINHDRLVDRNDYTSYMNYTGLRKGDGDFDGYISKGDLNDNGLIDAYDISVVATVLDGRAKPTKDDKVAGKLQISTAKQQYVKNDTVEIQVKGIDLAAVNALSFALPYDTQDFEYLGLANVQVGQMDNLTYDRLHSNGQKVLYPTFVNVGNQETLSGSKTLFVIKLKANRNVKFTLKASDGLLVDKNLSSTKF
jgi:alpha-glucosidase (family GH31 glycosyl hydrolase)